MKFKTGDRIVCINNMYQDGTVMKHINKYSEYVVENIVIINSSTISCKLEGIDKMGFNINRFITVGEFRRNKIEKIKDEIQKRGTNSMYQ